MNPPNDSPQQNTYNNCNFAGKSINAIAQTQLTLPQKLASHSAGYWMVHFVIGLLAAAVVEIAVSLLHAGH